jgi:hypothetical protein
MRLHVTSIALVACSEVALRTSAHRLLDVYVGPHEALTRAFRDHGLGVFGKHFHRDGRYEVADLTSYSDSLSAVFFLGKSRKDSV